MTIKITRKITSFKSNTYIPPFILGPKNRRRLPCPSLSVSPTNTDWFSVIDTLYFRNEAKVGSRAAYQNHPNFLLTIL